MKNLINENQQISKQVYTLTKKEERERQRKVTIKQIKNNYGLYLLLLCPFILLIVFSYAPMYGILIAFTQYSARLGVFGSKWIGFENFRRFFGNYASWQILRNTISISIFSIIAGIPLPIILAIGLNECISNKFKKSVQMITYAPYFISTVVLVGLVVQMLDLRTGVLNNIIAAFGGTPKDFMADPNLFRPIYVLSGIWQGTGFASILYIAALSSIDQELYEAAYLDGASKVKKIIYIDIPMLMPTFIILLILSCGSIMNVGFEKAYLMQNTANTQFSEVLSVNIYKMGLVNLDYGYSAAVGLFNSVINAVILIIVNKIAGKVSETSLF